LSNSTDNSCPVACSRSMPLRRRLRVLKEATHKPRDNKAAVHGGKLRAATALSPIVNLHRMVARSRPATDERQLNSTCAAFEFAKASAQPSPYRKNLADSRDSKYAGDAEKACGTCIQITGSFGRIAEHRRQCRLAMYRIAHIKIFPFHAS